MEDSAANSTLDAPVPATSPGLDAKQYIVLTSPGITEHSQSRCGRGCIIGAVVGSVGVAILITLVVALIVFSWNRRRIRQSRSTAGSQVDLLEDSFRSAPGRLRDQQFEAGDRVFCRDTIENGRCPTGTVVSHAGDDLYKVKFQDGVIHLVSNAHMAPHYQSDASVEYLAPDGSESIQCTVINADGSYWPPFYHIRPNNSSLDSINTIAEHLSTSASRKVDAFSSDIVAHAV